MARPTWRYACECGWVAWPRGNRGLVLVKRHRRYHQRARVEPARFRLAVEGDCWISTCHHNNKGYGELSFGRRMRHHHRIVYAATHGLSEAELAEIEVVRHSCDNPPCVNPAHLLAGTQADNVRDKVERNRQARVAGEEHYAARLTDDDVREIRRRYSNGATQRELAGAFGISPSHAGNVARRLSWQHVE